MFYLWCKASSGELRTWVWNVDQIAVTCQVVGFTCQGSSATGCRMTGEHSSTLHPEDTQKPSNWHILQHVDTLYPIQTYLYYKISVEFTNWYWIHPANIWDTGAGSRSAHCQIWICIALHCIALHCQIGICIALHVCRQHWGSTCQLNLPIDGQL